MRKYKVNWRWEGGTGSGIYTARSQFDVIMMIVTILSPDGIHAPECKISVVPLKD